MKLKEEIFTDSENSVVLYMVDDFDKLEVRCKWDGCCDIRVHFNNSTVSHPVPDEEQYVHICELKEFIDNLTHVYELATQRGYEV